MTYAPIDEICSKLARGYVQRYDTPIDGKTEVTYRGYDAIGMSRDEWMSLRKSAQYHAGGYYATIGTGEIMGVPVLLSDKPGIRYYAEIKG